jgi:hypothetical protein
MQRRGLHTTTGRFFRRGRQGQALLIAVLLMSVILLVGILFAAVVSYNQEQSSRHADVVAAQMQAEAGINYAASMLENSPQGADWRPRFRAYSGTGAESPDDVTTWPQDPALWPSPPAMYQDGTYDFNFYGPDGQPDSEDDYYSDFEIMRGWAPLREGSVMAPGPFVRLGFVRYPDPNQLLPGSGGGRDSQTMGRGYFLLQVVYDPDPPYEPGDPTVQDKMSGMTRIVSIGRAVEEGNVFRRVVAYKPLGLTDHLRWVTNKSNATGQAILGVRPGMDFNASGALEAGENLPTVFGGPVRSEAPLRWVGQNLAASPSTDPSCVFALRSSPRSNEGYLRDDFLLAPRGLEALDGIDADQGAGVAVNGGAVTTLPLTLGTDAPGAPDRVYVGTRDVPPLQAPSLHTVDPASGVSRYYALTRDSGPVRRAEAADARRGIAVGDPVNVGLYGHGRGLYIDNFDDRQFVNEQGEGDLRLLVDDWLQKLESSGYGGRDSGWNATFTTYTPPAVEIEFFPSEAAVAATASNGFSGTPPTTPGTLWWPNHTAGEPGIKITRHDRRWRQGDAGNVGADSGQNVMVVDYPAYPHQVIFAEGNVRVKGVLPATARDITGNFVRDYNVTVVSNGTIYIDGQLLSPQDVAGRLYGTNDPNVPNGVYDEDNTGVALLARDSVCLNPTQLVPQLTTGLVTAAADDPTNPSLLQQHWELYPDSGGSVFSQWRFGWPDMTGGGAPGTPIGAGVTVSVMALESGADPGPSGKGMVVYNWGTSTTTPYTFPGTGGALDPYTFIFAPPGALLPGSVPTPTAYASNAIAPHWQTPCSTPFQTFGAPTVPHPITSMVSTGVGTANGIAMFHRDPKLGAGSTAYRIKKWKIEESVGLLGYTVPRGAIHARVNALIYAERGSWFVIPGAYFDETAVTADYDGDGNITAIDSLYAARARRYNYEITVRGCITEDHTAGLDSSQEWTRKWAFPIYSADGATLSLSWGALKYEFDERLRMNRDQSLTTLTGTVRQASAMATTPESILPKLPCLPSSPTLHYRGGTY